MDPITTTTSLPSSPTTTSLQDLSAVAAAMALDMKAKVDVMQTTPKIKKLVRRNASDKLKLIQMVHDNPILWDSRLPNFKGAEEEKNRAWEQIGKEFNAPGRRVARAFKSLRESYRRELAHVKLMGNGFKPKWSLYEAMDFLREVIRERKSGSHSAEQTSLGLNLSAYVQLANNNNNHINNNNHHHKPSFSKVYSAALQSTFNKSALDLSKCSIFNLKNLTTDDYFPFVKSEFEASSHSNGGSACGSGSGSGSRGPAGESSPTASANNVPQPLPAHLNYSQFSMQQQQQQQQQMNSSHNDSRVSSTRNDTTQNSTFDDMDASSVRSGDEASIRNVALSHEGSDEVEELEAIDADFPYPLILDSNSPNSGGIASRNAVKRRKKHESNGNNGSTNEGDEEDDEDDDDYDDQMLQQHRHLRQQQQIINGNNGIAMAGPNIIGTNNGVDIPPPQTVREVLNSKFCGFISAKLNSMEDSDADNLMNKILMLLVQSQSQSHEGK